MMIAVNKADRAYTQFNQKFSMLKKRANGVPILPISAKEGTNLEVLLETIKEIVDQEKAKTELLK